jgi:S-adenosylmethionine:tRNA-ribosyltransferase-isomerase (queuine synthetase)
MNPFSNWLPIYYRDAGDIPRAFVVEFDGESYLFECRRVDDTDDYEDHFSVYRVPDDVIVNIDKVSWEEIGKQSAAVGRVKTRSIEFDPSKRQSINRRVFQFIDIDPA